VKTRRHALIGIAVCIGLNMLDGFDVLAMSFAASGVKADWHLLDSQLGALLSAGLVGMGLGSLLLSPCADRWGRRPVIILSLMLATSGMLGSAAARGYIDLLVLRVLTGIGIGGTIASVAVIVCEYAPERWRGAALAAYATGYSIGATIGGAFAAYAIPLYGWRSAFAIGGTLSLLILPFGWLWLPESRDFNLARRPSAVGRGSIRGSIAPLMNASTMLVWVVFFCTMAAFYFIVSWTPRLLNAAGLSARQGLTGGVLLNLGGIAGCGLFAYAALRIGVRRLLLGALLASAVLIAGFGGAVTRLDIALWTALLLGVIANAAMAGLYAFGPPLYPTAVRATGMGWAIGIGRFGAILAPLASGLLLDHGWAPAQLYFLFSVPFLVAAVALLLIRSEGGICRISQ
jgi:MFS family permease